MPVDPEFAEMMPHTVKVYSAATVNKYGQQSFSGSFVSYQCRLIWDERMVRKTDGREVVEAGRAVVYGVAVVSVDDRIELPDGSAPLVTTVGELKDEVGDHHSVIGFGG